MGWWPITPNAGGGIDWNKARAASGLINKVPGDTAVETAVDLVNGDEPADIIGGARKAIAQSMIQGFNTKKLFRAAWIDNNTSATPYASTRKILDNARAEIIKCYQESWQRDPTKEEWEAIIDFAG